jgi:hypothetical protein
MCSHLEFAAPSSWTPWLSNEKEIIEEKFTKRQGKGAGLKGRDYNYKERCT